MKKRAPFITFEGIEGVGKSTQIRAVNDHYRNLGLKVFCTREPGGSPLSDGIRNVLLRSSDVPIDPISELLLIVAARRQHVVDVLEKEVLQNDLVLCDRFIDSSMAYQGGGRQIDLQWISSLNEKVIHGLIPDLTILLDAPIEQALARAMKRMEKAKIGEAEDRFEKEKLDFHKRVRETFLMCAKKEPGRFFVVDATESAEKITKALIVRIDSVRKLTK